MRHPSEVRTVVRSDRSRKFPEWYSLIGQGWLVHGWIGKAPTCQKVSPEIFPLSVDTMSFFGLVVSWKKCYRGKGRRNDEQDLTCRQLRQSKIIVRLKG